MQQYGRILVGVALTVVCTAGLLSLVKVRPSTGAPLASANGSTATLVVVRTPPPLPQHTEQQRFLDTLPPLGTSKVDDCRVVSSHEIRAGVLDAVRRNQGDLALQNKIADSLGLNRPKSTEDLKSLVNNGWFEKIGETDSYYLGKTFADEDPQNRDLYAYALPSMKRFLDEVLGEGLRCFKDEFARAEQSRLIVETRDRDGKIKQLTRKFRKNKHRLAEEKAKVQEPDPGPLFHKFIVNSLTRTEHYQKLILGNRHNPASRYAALGTTSEDRTPHTTGAVVDISGGSLTIPVRTWLRARLAEMERRHEIVAIEESNGCFHIMVIPYSARLPDRFPVGTKAP